MINISRINSKVSSLLSRKSRWVGGDDEWLVVSMTCPCSFLYWRYHWLVRNEMIGNLDLVDRRSRWRTSHLLRRTRIGCLLRKGCLSIAWKLSKDSISLSWGCGDKSGL